MENLWRTQDMWSEQPIFSCNTQLLNRLALMVVLKFLLRTYLGATDSSAFTWRDDLKQFPRDIRSHWFSTSKACGPDNIGKLVLKNEPVLKNPRFQSCSI